MKLYVSSAFLEGLRAALPAAAAGHLQGIELEVDPELAPEVAEIRGEAGMECRRLQLLGPQRSARTRRGRA